MTRPDPVLLAMKAAVAVLAVITALMIAAGIRSAQAQAAIHCPPQDHPVQAQVLVHHHYRTEWICGASLTIGVKAR